MASSLAESLKQQIDHDYSVRGYKLGWRLLYSPPSVLDGARVAFVGLNPGGSSRPVDHAEFAMARGSAYALENWGAAPGRSKLQQQVLSLFSMIKEPPERVLAGNLVPFRSPSWSALADRIAALKFGRAIWERILSESSPSLVICMAGEAMTALKDILSVRQTERIPVGWGEICGERGEYERGTLVRIPHLSRFAIMNRPASVPGLRRLLAAS